MNKLTILNNIENLNFKNIKNYNNVFESAIEHYFSIFKEINIDALDLTNMKTIASTIGFITAFRTHDNISYYHSFLTRIYEFAQINGFADDICKIYIIVCNLVNTPQTIFDKYFILFLNKENSYGIDKAFDTMFGGGDRYRFGDQFENNELLIILQKLSKMKLNKNIINDFNYLVYNLCVRDQYIYHWKIIDFCEKFDV